MMYLFISYTFFIMKERDLIRVQKNIGKVFSRRTVIQYAQHKRWWHYLCRCSCGNEKVVDIQHLNSWASKSCGCLRSEFMKDSVDSWRIRCVQPQTKHWLAWTPIYRVWYWAKKRGLSMDIEEFKDKYYDEYMEFKDNNEWQICFYEIDWCWKFIRQRSIKKIQNQYIIDWLPYLIGDIIKTFSISNKIAHRIINQHLHTKKEILNYIKEHKLKNRWFIEYKWELYNSKWLCSLHTDITWEELHHKTIKKRIYNWMPLSLAIESEYKTSSSWEIELADYIKSIYDWEVKIWKKYNIWWYKFEIDILLKDKNMWFEFNWNYYHSTKFVTPGYHHKKKIWARWKDISLYFIRQDLREQKKNIVKSIIASKLWISKRIYARNTKIKIIDSETYNDFLNNNHIQWEGWWVSVCYWLLSETNTLLAVMWFRWTELVRYCNIVWHTIIWWFSKILKKYIKDFNPQRIVSFADLDIVDYDNNVYSKNWFKLEYVNTNIYFYMKWLHRFHRWLFKKKYIKSKFNYEFKEWETEHQAMSNLWFDRCFSSGLQRYVLTLK